MGYSYCINRKRPMARYSSVIKQNADGFFYAMVVRIDSDGFEQIDPSFRCRSFASLKAAERATVRHISKI